MLAAMSIPPHRPRVCALEFILSACMHADVMHACSFHRTGLAEQRPKFPRALTLSTPSHRPVHRQHSHRTLTEQTGVPCMVRQTCPGRAGERQPHLPGQKSDLCTSAQHELLTSLTPLVLRASTEPNLTAWRPFLPAAQV
jgi:phage tail protein X